jgi:glycosyltransferase involved in cell wall biosynthesis
MRVLFQSRRDAFDCYGGDTTQMMQTKKYLEKLGAEVFVDLSLDPDLSQMSFDLVHIFNIQNADYALIQLKNAKKYNLPVVLSTIYWDMNNGKVSSSVKSIFRNFYRSIPYSFLKHIPLYSKTSTGRRRYRYDKMSDMLAMADLLLPNSVAESEQLALHFLMPSIRQKIKIIPNGVDKEIASLSQCSDCHGQAKVVEDLPDSYVLQVARIEPIKGQLHVIESLAKYADIPIVFLGRSNDSVYMDKCKKAAISRGNVYFIDQVKSECVRIFYKKAKVHVLPSMRESPGLVTLEASMFLCNCVVSFHGPVVEYFGDMVQYCDPENNQSVESAIILAWTSNKSRKLRRFVLDNFTWEIAASKTYEAYKGLLLK